MPLSVMETVELEKVSNKCKDIQDIKHVKTAKTIMDFFKTPEKPVISRQKNLLQYFAKPNLEICREKENEVVLKERSSSENESWSTNVDTCIAEDETLKAGKENTAQKGEKDQEETENEALSESKDNKNSHTDCVTKENPTPDDMQDSIVILADSSASEEAFTEHSGVKGDNNGILPEQQALESKNENNFDVKLKDSEVDSHEKINKNINDKSSMPITLITEDQPAEVTDSIEIEENDRQGNTCEEKSNQREQNKQDEDIFVKPQSSRLLAKKKTLRCQEMMNLLKETLASDIKIKKKSRHHKHKHKQKEKVDKEIENKNSSLKDIVNEKRKRRKGEIITDSGHELHSTEKKSDGDSGLILDNAASKDRESCLIQIQECEREKENSEGVKSSESFQIEYSRKEQESIEKHNSAAKAMTEKQRKIKRTDNNRSKLKKKTKVKTEESCSLESIENETTVKNSESKSISYEDFLKRLEKEPSFDTGEIVTLEEDEKTEKINAEAVEGSEENVLEEYMDVSEIKESEIEEQISVVDGNSETHKTKISEIVAFGKSQSSNVTVTSEVKEKQSKSETKSDLITETKGSGIARFFTVLTSTPGKPKRETDNDSLREEMNSPNRSRKAPKTKKSKKCDKITKDSRHTSTETVSEQILKSEGLEDSNMNRSDSIEIIEENGEIGSKNEIDEEAQKRKQEFLTSKSSVGSCKTTQAVLSFGASGFTVTKSENRDVISDNEESMLNLKEKKSQTPKGKKGTKLAGKKSKPQQSLSDDSCAFETPKGKGKVRKSKTKHTTDIDPSESEESFHPDQTGDSEDMSERRSLRSSTRRYKVAKFEMDEEKRTPIKLKLKRDKNNSSCDEIDSLTTKTKKSKLTSKQSTAKALIDKAKKQKKKAGLKQEHTDKERKREKKERKQKKKSRRESEKDSGDEVVEHRRSSRLVGKIMPSMEEVSLDNIVILSDEDEEAAMKVKKRKAKKTEKLGKKKDTVQEVPTVKDSPKPKRVASPQKKTGTPKKQGKLAPIFIGKTKPTEEKKPPLDPELAKQRMQFLMSGVPDELKKQSAKTQAAVIPSDYPPLPTVSHIFQMPKIVENNEEGSRGELDVWHLQTVRLKFRNLDENGFIAIPQSKLTGDLVRRQIMNVDLSLLQNYTCHLRLDSQTEEVCVGEICCYNPGFPVNKLFSALRKLKDAAEQSQQDSDSKSDVKSSEPETVTVIDGESDKKKRGRKSKLKLQKEEKSEVKAQQASSEVPEKKKYVKNLLWTDKYQPSSSTEVIGNSSSMKKLKTWLSEWKHILDREAKKARKLLMKKNKGKLQKTEVPDDLWDEDSDFDLDSDSSDIEDTLCNTMLITGPHGSGKTAAVYALAQELGFKVHEVNASSSRNGKKILSQLQEATQSHQVSHQGLGTPVKNSSAPGPATPKPAKMPTAFTNLFSKKKDISSSIVIDVDEKKNKKRKREPTDIEESPKKKRSKKTDTKEKKENKTKTLKPTFLDIDESSNGLVQGLNLSSTTMIVFDEVDLVFEDDKGFLSAVQTFMSTTKIPIILTTARSSFAAQFDGRFETLTFKYPSKSSLCSYIQLICLLEGLRVDPLILSELLQLLKCDVRKSLLTVQFISESGGSLSQTFRSVAKLSSVSASQVVPAVEDTIENSQGSKDSSKTSSNPMFNDNDNDDFVMLKPRTNRSRRLLEDDNSNSVDAFAQVFHQRQLETMPTSVENEDAKVYPIVHGLGIGSLVDLALGKGENFQDIILRNLKMPISSNLLELCNACEVHRTVCQNIMSNNLPLLLPLVTRVTSHVISAKKDDSGERKGKKRKRIQTDLYDSEASNDATEASEGIDTLTKAEENSVDETKSENVSSNKAENLCSSKALSAFSRYYDTVGMLDIVETQERMKVVNCVRTTCGSRTYGSVQPGLDDSLPGFHTQCDLDCELTRNYSTEVEVRSMSRLYQDIDKIQGEVEELCRNNPAYSEDFVLPVLTGNEKFSLVDRNCPRPASGEQRAEDNIVQNLPPIVYKQHRSLQLDYLPTLREISRTEHTRQIANTKRRFQHYFDSITLPLKDTTLNILSTTFT